MNVCFIGHRNLYDRTVREELYNVIENLIMQGADTFVMGVHGEFDAYALDCCRELRNKYKIKIEVVLTSLSSLTKACNGATYNPYDDVEVIMYQIETLYFKRRIIESNKEMIKQCDILVCYVDERKYKSGAGKVLQMAKKFGKEIINLFKDKVSECDYTILNNYKVNKKISP